MEKKDQMNAPTERVLVTGVAGFIAGHFAERLLKSGYYVVGLDDLSTSHYSSMSSYIRHPNFEFIEDSVLNEPLLKKLCGAVGGVFHGAVRGLGSSIQKPREELRVNTEGTLNVLEACRENKQIRRVIIPSSASVYGSTGKLPQSECDVTRPASPYGVSKLAAENYALVYASMYGMPIVTLRYFNTYGPRQKHDSLYGGVVSIFVNNITQNLPLEIYGDGSQTRDFTYIDDCIDVTQKIYESEIIKSHLYNVGTGVETSVNAVAKHLLGICNREVEIISVKPRLVDNVPRRAADISLLQFDHSYLPKIGISHGLKKTFEHYAQ